MVRRKAARHLRRALADGGIVQMLLIGPLSDAGDLGVVDLYLVMHLIGAERGAAEEGDQNGDAC
jgi:hypothetical protein